MSDTTMLDHEQVISSIRERNQQVMATALRSQRDLVEVMEQSLLAFAEAEEKLAEATDAEWLARLLRAQAGFTRDLVSASGKFARELQES